MSAARRYLLTYAALLLLTATTLALSAIPLGAAGIALALGIATLKGVLIALFFMHLREQRAINTLFILVSLVLVIFFVALSALDAGTRAVSG